VDHWKIQLREAFSSWVAIGFDGLQDEDGLDGRGGAVRAAAEPVVSWAYVPTQDESGGEHSPSIGGDLCPLEETRSETA
jgi:hypothetical protein